MSEREQIYQTGQHRSSVGEFVFAHFVPWLVDSMTFSTSHSDFISAIILDRRKPASRLEAEGMYLLMYAKLLNGQRS